MECSALALIPAAGQGTRFGSEKQFLQLAGAPLLAHTLRPFQESSMIKEIVLVVPKGWEKRVLETIIKPHALTKVRQVVTGGPERQDSVRLGLEALETDSKLILIHDGARPLVTEEIIARAVQDTYIHGATLVGVPATDTIVQANAEGMVVRTLNRETLWMVQTPQSFRHELIRRAHQEAKIDGFVGTDDASLVERLGHAVKVIPGSYENIKVTTAQDFKLAEEILLQRQRAQE